MVLVKRGLSFRPAGGESRRDSAAPPGRAGAGRRRSVARGEWMHIRSVCLTPGLLTGRLSKRGNRYTV